jgi:hypothetical protein
MTFLPAKGIPGISLLAPGEVLSLANMQFIVNAADAFVVFRSNCLGYLGELIPCSVQIVLEACSLLVLVCLEQVPPPLR